MTELQGDITAIKALADLLAADPTCELYAWEMRERAGSVLFQIKASNDKSAR